MNPEILITGAEGFVGRRLAAALRARGSAVVGIDQAHGDIASCALPFPGVKHVFHLAARMFVPASWENPSEFYSTNVMGAVNVLEFCRREGASLTLVSSYVYGRPQRLPIPEDHPIEAYNPYSQTKIIAEEIAGFYAEKFGVAVTIVRPFNLYGPGQDERFLIPSLVRQAIDPGTPAIRVADARPRRDYLHIDDFIALLMATHAAGEPGTYNAGSGQSTSIGELAAILNRITGRDKPLVSEGRERPEEILDVVADISRAADRLRWKPAVAVEDGIASVVRAATAPTHA
jgi:nucleoside-diphosphate-sugar epimerase